MSKFSQLLQRFAPLDDEGTDRVRAELLRVLRTVASARGPWVVVRLPPEARVEVEDLLRRVESAALANPAALATWTARLAALGVSVDTIVAAAAPPEAGD